MAYWLEGAPARPESSSHQVKRIQVNVLRTPRARHHTAFLVTLAIVAFLSFAIFPAERLILSADGGFVVAVSRNSSSQALFKAAGLQTAPGDRLVRDHNELRIERSTPVLVQADGRLLGWWTRAASLREMLAELDIKVGPNDTVTLDGVEVGLDGVLPPTPFVYTGKEQFPSSAPVIGIRRAVPLTVLIDGRSTMLESSRLTLGEALADAGIRLNQGDLISHALPTEPSPGMLVEIRRAREVTLRIGSTSRTLRTQKQTLGEVLTEAGIYLGPEDRVEPSLNATVTNGMSARLVRVSGRQFVEREEIKHKTVFKPDDSLSGSATRTVPGRDGVLVREYSVVIEDGVEREKRLVREYYEPEVRDTIIYYAATTLHTTGIPLDTLQVQRTERVYATWYNAASSGKDPSDPSYGRTATGTPVVKGIVAVDPAVIPLGSRMYVPGYGFAVAADTGGAVKGNIIDLGYPDGVTPDWRTGWVEIFILAP